MQQHKQHRYSKLFRHTFKAFLIYLLFWGLGILALLIGVLCGFFEAFASVVFSLIPHLLKLGCILSVVIIVALVYEGIREEMKRDD